MGGLCRSGLRMRLTQCYPIHPHFPPSQSCWVALREPLATQIGKGQLITLHFSTNLLSTSESALIPYLNTDSPFIHGFPSFTLQSSLSSLHHTAINQHVQSR